MKRLIATAVLLAVALFGSAAASVDTVAVCGPLRSFTAPTREQNVGSATVGDKTYPLSGTPGPNTLSPQATVGSNVCLTGQLAQVDTGPANLLIRWSITPDNSSSSPAPSAPLTSTSSTPSASSEPAATLPTTTSGSILDQPVTMLALALTALLAVLVVTRIAKRRRRLAQ